MRFDEFVLSVADDPFRVKFHPRLTVLAGLPTAERAALTSSILLALTGGGESTALRYQDADDRTVDLLSHDGTLASRYDDDGSPAPLPVGHWAPTREALATMILLQASDVVATSQPIPGNEPRELTDARAILAQLAEEVESARSESQRASTLTAELTTIDEHLRTAHDTVAQRAYASVLARLDRLRAEVAALDAGTVGIAADRKLGIEAAQVLELAAGWQHALAALQEGTELGVPEEALDAAAVAEGQTIPGETPDGLDEAIAALVEAQADRENLDHQLQIMAVATLPAPSDLIVGELGLVDQTQLWGAAENLQATSAELARIQITLGGLGRDAGPGPSIIESIEANHLEVEDARQRAESLYLTGATTVAVGGLVALAGVLSTAVLIPVGILGAALAATVLFLRPWRRLAHAVTIERDALETVGATTYLAFHIRRVDATIDPLLRESVHVATAQQRAARGTWVEMAGAEVDVEMALSLQQEVRAYHDAARNLGGAAGEIVHLRREIAENALPAVARARARVEELCGPFGLSSSELAVATNINRAIHQRVHFGMAARRQAGLAEATAQESQAAARLEHMLGQLGFNDGDLAERAGRIHEAVEQAAEREDARAQSRPRHEIDAEFHHLQELARQQRRPEWATVTAADAIAPDIADLEQQRENLLGRLAEGPPTIDLGRLQDRHAAIERRVESLEIKHLGHEAGANPGAVEEIQRLLVSHLTTAAHAGPNGDAIPTLLDEVLLRVPAKRMWDLLDVLHRLSEQTQIILLSDDPFVAAWARQQAPTGSLRLLEPAPV